MDNKADLIKVTVGNHKELANCLQTSIITKDGEKVVLFTTEHLTDEEKEEFAKFTLKELRILMDSWGFKTSKVEEVKNG